MDKRVVVRLHIHAPGKVTHECFSAMEASRVFHTVVAIKDVEFVLWEWIDQDTGSSGRCEIYRRSTGRIEAIDGILAGALLAGGVE